MPDVQVHAGQRDPFARRAYLCLLTGFALTAIAGLLSDGVYHEDDLQHFLMVRWVGHDLRYLLDEWGRPGFTIPYTLPALLGSQSLGWHACRLLSAAMAATTAWLAYRIARQYRLRHAWLAVPLLYLQPLITHLALTTLTETPLAFYCTLATWLLLQNRPTASAAIIALAPVTRHEAIVFLPVWAIALWRIRAAWWNYPLLFWAMMTHNLAAGLWLETLPVARFVDPSGSTQYGRGTLLTFIPKLAIACGPVVVALALMGTRRILHRPWGWLCLLAPLSYFVAETVVYRWGAYSSGGYSRFLVPLAGWLAVLATAGAQTLCLRRRLCFRYRALAVCGLFTVGLCVVGEIEWWLNPPEVAAAWLPFVVPIRIALACGCVLLALAAFYLLFLRRLDKQKPVGRFVFVTLLLSAVLPAVWALIPLRVNPQHQIMRDAAAEFTRQGWDRPPMLAANLWMYYWTNRHRPQGRFDLWTALAESQPGTLFVWDARFCPDPDIGVPCGVLSDAPEWQLLWTSRPQPGDSAAFLEVYERITAR